MDDFNNQFVVVEDTKSLSTDRDSNGSKYDTVPNIRNSAKNRKKLEKIFSLGHNGKTKEIFMKKCPKSL
jgi:hypothetical protein